MNKSSMYPNNSSSYRRDVSNQMTHHFKRIAQARGKGAGRGASSSNKAMVIEVNKRIVALGRERKLERRAAKEGVPDDKLDQVDDAAAPVA